MRLEFTALFEDGLILAFAVTKNQRYKSTRNISCAYNTELTKAIDSFKVMLKNLRNINLLRTFESAARHQGYGSAATELHVSQAAVSQQMRQLESELNCQLFIRKGRKMVLTQQGTTLLNTTQQAFSLLQTGINEITTESLNGSLTITSTQAFTTLWLMPRLHKFSELHPDIKINVTSSSDFADLKQQHIDLAIRFGINVEKNTSSDHVCEYFGEAPAYPICSAQLAETISMKKAEDLLKAWLIRLEQPNPYDWASWFDHAGVEAHQHHQQWTQVNSTDMALNAVLNGHGVTLAAKYLCTQHLESGQLIVPFDIPHPNVIKRYLVFDPTSAKKARLKVFTDWLVTEMH